MRRPGPWRGPYSPSGGHAPDPSPSRGYPSPSVPRRGASEWRLPYGAAAVSSADRAVGDGDRGDAAMARFLVGERVGQGEI
ncbi:hypothetical protein E2562_019155 [Oryza meyeriana var. granulata]|uniref:Uncharacterized protein n=1 Tax=Oryza meyeriana var. granulata TaxID=110450 RepID=A0A6G1CQF2_9ORYZ|nr:hypothetical protein E2562_019155 [Oryza meyeriana var. granulata]